MNTVIPAHIKITTVPYDHRAEQSARKQNYCTGIADSHQHGEPVDTNDYGYIQAKHELRSELV